MSSEKKELISSLVFPFLFILFLWLVKIVEVAFDISFVQAGLFPLSYKGLIGIVTAPLIHADFSHLIANTTSLFVLGFLLFSFYRKIAFRVLFLIWIFTGVWVWFLGRESYHIGASGLVYGIASFLFVSGIIRRNPRLMVVTLVIAFLYGSMVWGVFPEFFPDKPISWESHLMGMVAGLILAIFYRKQGPQKKRYSWEFEDEDDDEDDPNAYWKMDERHFRRN